MNIKTLKMALVLAAILALIGGAFSKQIVPMSIAADGPGPKQAAKLAEKRGLWNVKPQFRQQAIAWALMDEIRTELGPERAKKIRAAQTPSELHAYLQRVVNACKKQQKKCPVAKAALAGHDGKAKGLKDQHYGKDIANAAKSYSQVAEASSCDEPDDPAPSCGVMECLYWWGDHIGPCDSECGGLNPDGPMCPGEGEDETLQMQ